MTDYRKFLGHTEIVTLPFCGMNGSLAGDYFPADDLPDNPCAGIPPGQCRE